MKLSISRLPFLAFALFVGLLAVALVRHYSDVPFWDMWDGYLDFYNRVLNGDLSAWWYQHNEHRIILSRLLFWMDLAWFGGKSAFLIVVNFLLAVAAALLMGAIFREMFRGQPHSNSHWLLYTLCLTMPLSWMQKENLAWAFQSQFFLAQLLPLVAFYCFYRSEDRQSWGWFWASLAVAVASAGTMANGLAALPILAIVALLASEARFRKFLCYGLAAIVVLSLYFSGYQSPSGHGSLASTIATDALGMFQYTALYIGSPFQSLLNTVTPGSWSGSIFYFAMISGFCLMFGTLLILSRVLRRPRVYVFEMALLGFIAYIGATAFGTAGGRLFFGLEQALSGRYRTPAILLWLCFFILLLKTFGSPTQWRYARGTANFGLSSLLVLLLITQFSGAKSDNQINEFGRNMAVLAMSLGIKDSKQIKQVFPSVDSVMSYARNSIANEISVFSEGSRFYRLAERNQTPLIRDGSERCQGAVDDMVPVIGDDNHLRIRGWLFEGDTESNKPYPLFSPDGEPKGYLLLGQVRPDVAQAVSPEAMHSGFGGYITRQPDAEPRITVQLEEKTCWMDLPSSDVPFQISEPDWGETTITVGDVINNVDWDGKDFYKTDKSGFTIKGSFRNSDQDTGSLTLAISDGDSVMFRTGPDSTGLFLFNEQENMEFSLPRSEEWGLLTFRMGGKGKGKYMITFIDRGTGWGQWAAVGIKSDNEAALGD